MKTTIPKLRRMIQDVLNENYYDQEAEDIRDEHRGYREEEEEDKIYSPEFGWVTHEELAELESQMYESVRLKENTVKLSKRQLKRIILEEKRRLLEARQPDRPIREIAQEISADWQNASPAARPYLDAMHSLDSIEDRYGMDDAAGIVEYFLSNARSWKGETAKRVKKELKKMVNKYYRSQGY